MVLVDTSIWIRSFRNRAPYAATLDALLDSEDVAGHPLVYGELLIGDRGGRELFLDLYQQMHQTGTVAHDEVVDFVRARKLHGRGIGWIDAHLLASALAERIQLWTADPRLGAIAGELGVSYEL